MVRINDLPPPKVYGWGNGLVFTSRSNTRPGMYHVTIYLGRNEVSGNSMVMCSCEGFQNHKKCWHAEGIAQVSGDSGYDAVGVTDTMNTQDKAD